MEVPAAARDRECYFYDSDRLFFERLILTAETQRRREVVKNAPAIKCFSFSASPRLGGKGFYGRFSIVFPIRRIRDRVCDLDGLSQESALQCDLAGRCVPVVVVHIRHARGAVYSGCTSTDLRRSDHGARSLRDHAFES